MRNHLLSAWHMLAPQLAPLSGLGKKLREPEIRLARGLQFQSPTLYKVDGLETPSNPKGVCPGIMGSRLVFPLGYGMLAFGLELWIHNGTSRLPQVERGCL